MTSYQPSSKGYCGIWVRKCFASKCAEWTWEAVGNSLVKSPIKQAEKIIWLFPATADPPRDKSPTYATVPSDAMMNRYPTPAHLRPSICKFAILSHSRFQSPSALAVCGVTEWWKAKYLTWAAFMAGPQL